MAGESVTNNEAGERYELSVNGATALAVYRVEDGVVSFVQTEVPRELEGQGVGSRLIEGALADVRERGLKILPLCSFVRHYVDRHPEVQDLVAE